VSILTQKARLRPASKTNKNLDLIVPAESRAANENLPGAESAAGKRQKEKFEIVTIKKSSVVENPRNPRRRLTLKFRQKEKSKFRVVAGCLYFYGQKSFSVFGAAYKNC